MRSRYNCLSFVGLTVALVVALPALANDSAARFVEQVQPLLESKCVSCHGPEKQEGGLRLDSLAAAKAGGDRGPAIVPGAVEKSLLVKAITFRDPELQMPPKQMLPEKEIGILTRWVKDGAAWPEPVDAYRPNASPSTGGSPVGDAFTDRRNPIRKLFGGERLDLWSLQKPILSSPHAPREEQPNAAQKDAAQKDAGKPSAASSASVATKASAAPGLLHAEREGYIVIDALIRERWERAGVRPSPEADRRTLIRRLTFDLTGLPPTTDEVAAFVADQAPDAYDKRVARLLDSPRYGERQARLWLDVVRYADTNGYERDEFRPLMWQYRDYVIRSFNQDKPFDRFIREQLAGDELVSGAPKTSAEADMLIATGFLRLGQWDSTAAIFQEEHRLRAEIMADLTNTTASAFLGLTMSCCQCHDHKYDPFSQADHFRLRAFFAGVTARDDLAITLADEQSEIDKHNADLDQQAEPFKTEQSKLDKANKQRHEKLEARIAEFESKKRQPRRAIGATDAGPTAPATHVFYQGDFLSPREEVQPGFVSVLAPGAAEIQPPRDDTTGRRLALANWIASADNPWTARVIVNRVWQQHFGVGLVATPNDFGFSGSRPTHPELLDGLAVEFMRRGWSIKELHRRIVTSAVYRQASRETADGRRVDSGNHLLGRQNVRRLDAETLRDALLSVAGVMQPYDTGKPLWPPVPDELLKAQPAILEAEKGGDGGRMQGWYADPIERTDVRSVFLIRKRCLPIPFLQAFDLPDTIVSCARRDTTVVAPQALMLLNSPEGVRYAQAFAERVRAAHDVVSFDEEVQTYQLITLVFQLALQRDATTEEIALASEFLRRHRTHHAAREADRATMLALTDLCRAILNLNEFTYID